MQKRIFKPFEDEKPEAKENSSGNRMETQYAERYDENGKAYLEKVGEVDTYEKIQSYRDECDVMAILSRYAAGDETALAAPGWYIDTSKLPSTYTEYMNMMNEQREKFDQLPLSIRNKFNNNFNEYMATAGEESWMRNMGITTENVAAASNENRQNGEKQKEGSENK